MGTGMMLLPQGPLHLKPGQPTHRVLPLQVKSGLRNTDTGTMHRRPGRFRQHPNKQQPSQPRLLKNLSVRRDLLPKARYGRMNMATGIISLRNSRLPPHKRPHVPRVRPLMERSGLKSTGTGTMPRRNRLKPQHRHQRLRQVRHRKEKYGLKNMDTGIMKLQVTAFSPYISKNRLI